MKENNCLVYVQKDEYDEVLCFLKKMREEKAKQQAIIDQEQLIGAVIGNAISVIGLEETKRIVQRAARDLRNKSI